MFPERHLQWRQRPVARKPLHSEDLRAIGLDCEHQTSAYCPTSHDDGAGPANTMFTAKVRTSKPKLLAQHIGERHPGRDLKLNRRAVDHNLDPETCHITTPSCET